MARHPDQLSTLKSIYAALMQPEGRAENLQATLTAFGGFAARQIGHQEWD